MANESVIAVTPDGQGMESCQFINPDNVIAGDTPQETGYTFLSSDDEKFSIGVWETTACTEKITCYPADEFCTVLKGHVIITTDDGNAQRFNVGDSFSIKKGTSLIWEMPETFRKYYVIYG